MRTIKFRAWDNRKKEWLLGYKMSHLGGFSLDGELVLLGEWASVLNTFMFSRDGYTPDDLKVMQFTGLKDKNGKEIYEGDILKDYSDAYVDHKKGMDVLWTVKWAIEFAMFVLENFDDVSEMQDGTDPSPKQYIEKHCEIIGNIYENPELLK